MASENRPRPLELALWAPALAVVVLAAAYEVVVRQSDAYLGPGQSTPRVAAVAMGALGACAGWWTGKQLASRVERRGLLLIRLASLLAVLCAGSGPLWFWAFATPSVLPGVAWLLPFSAGFLGGAALGALQRGVGWPYRELGAVRILLSPITLAAALLVTLSSSVALSYLGLWRAGAALAGALAAIAALGPRLHEYVSELEPPRSRAPLVGFAAATLSFAAAQAFVPARLLSRYSAELVWASEEAGCAVVAAQNTFELFEADQLRATSVDDYRLGELAVHPALHRLPSRRRVLVLGPAGGILEREVLRYPDVAELVSLSELARPALSGLLWPHRAAEARERTIVAELIPWLEEHPAPFDAIVVSLPLPAMPEDGKYYSRFFFELLASRLTASGALVVQATPRHSMPRTFGTVAATLSATGLTLSTYQAPLPLLGDVSFIVGSRGRASEVEGARLPPGLRYLDAAALQRARNRSDLDISDSPVSTLAHQHALVAWHEERERVGN